METSARRRARARAEIVRLVHRDQGVTDFVLRSAAVLRRAVGFDGVCVVTLDPATLLPTSEVVDHGLPPAARGRLAEIEVAETDFNKFAALAHAGRPAASLSAATGGDLDRSLRQRELRTPHGLGDELRGVLVDDGGTWGAITLQREVGRSFSAGDTQFVASLSASLAEGIRRALLHDELAAPAAAGAAAPVDAGVGLLVLAADNSVELANAAARRWLDELRRGEEPAGDELPPVVHAVAGRARLAATDPGPAPDAAVARARARTAAGRWVLVRGSLLDDGARAAVILEPVPAADLAPLIAAAYGLTERERHVTQLVAQGHATDEVARRLHLSPYTVQDHLKSIFAKLGVTTRGALVARLFFEHYAPQLTNGDG